MQVPEVSVTTLRGNLPLFAIGTFRLAIATWNDVIRLRLQNEYRYQSQGSIRLTVVVACKYVEAFTFTKLLTSFATAFACFGRYSSGG